MGDGFGVNVCELSNCDRSIFAPIFEVKRCFGFPSLVVLSLLHPAHDRTARPRTVIRALGPSTIAVQLQYCVFERGRHPLEDVPHQHTHLKLYPLYTTITTQQIHRHPHTHEGGSVGTRCV